MLDWLKQFWSEIRSEPGQSSSDPMPEDPLLRKAWLIRRKSELGQKASKKTIEEEGAAKAVQAGVEELQWAARFVRNSAATAATIWDDYLRPFLLWTLPLFRLLKRFYIKIYKRFAFKKDAEGERTEFCRKRSALTVVSLFGATLLGLYLAVFKLVPAIFLFTYDAVAINLFAYEDSLVFSKPDWVEGEPGVLSVFACRKYPCIGQDDSVEFRIRDSVYLDVLRTLTRLEPHDPGELAGAFLSEENACNFKAYGIRVKYLHLYPYIVEATCHPIDESERDFPTEF